MTVSTGTCTGEITFKVAKAPLEVAYCHILVFYYRYEYIAVYDTDEVIVPRHHTNWADLGKDFKKKCTEMWNFCFVFGFRTNRALGSFLKKYES